MIEVEMNILDIIEKYFHKNVRDSSEFLCNKEADVWFKGDNVWRIQTLSGGLYQLIERTNRWVVKTTNKTNLIKVRIYPK